MFELLFAAFAVGTSIKIADTQPVSTVVHAGLAILLMILAVLLIPIPYVRVVIAFVASFAAMTIDKMRRNDAIG